MRNGPRSGTLSSSEPAAVDAGFFLLRTPAWPLSTVSELGCVSHDWESAPDSKAQVAGASLRGIEALRGFCEDPYFQEAVKLASPDLYREMRAWRARLTQDFDGVALSLARYVMRMSSRPTPFGLFAGYGLGRVDDVECVSITVPALANCSRRTRLDGRAARAALSLLLQDAGFRRGLRFRANPTWYAIDGKIRLTIEKSDDEGTWLYELVDVDPTPAVYSLLSDARSGLNFRECVARVEAGGATPEQSLAFVEAAIEAQLLVPCGVKTLTGLGPSAALLKSVADADQASLGPARELVKALLATGTRLQEADERSSFGVTSVYAECERELAAAGLSVPRGALAQVDLIKPGLAGCIPRAVVHEITALIDKLARIGPTPPDSPIREFAFAFEDRFGATEVPLLEALDPDFGISLDGRGALTSEHPAFVSVLTGASAELDASRAATANPRILQLLVSALRSGEPEIVLDLEDLDPLRSDAALPLPPTLYAFGELIPGERFQGDAEVVLRGATGPSALALLGRFATGIPELALEASKLTRSESDLYPDAVLAEVVHAPSSRVANIAARPLLREYEIPYLSESGAPPDRQIALRDLVITARRGVVTLRSARLGKAVIPRSGTAHVVNSPANTAVYRFLRLLEAQHTRVGIKWTWEGLSHSPYLPRVRVGRVIVSLATWRLAPKDKEAFAAARSAVLMRRVAGVRRKYGLPRFVRVVEFDQRLLVDLDSPLSVAAVAVVIRRQDTVVLEECPDLAAPDRDAPNLSYASEFTLPLKGPTPRNVPRYATGSNGSPLDGTRSFGPGSRWLYFKVYAPPNVLQRILLETILPLSVGLEEAGTTSDWFYVRYVDPEPHLRVRFRGDPKALMAEALPHVGELLNASIERGLCRRWGLDTYLRETARYGTGRCMEISEELFSIDSRAACSIMLEAGDDPAALWHAAIASACAHAQAWGVTHGDIRDWSDVRTGRRVGEHLYDLPPGVLPSLLSRTHREHRTVIESIAESLRRRTAPSAILRERSELSSHLIDELRRRRGGAFEDDREQLFSDHLHMHVNRLFTEAHSTYEYVLWDALRRIFASVEARGYEDGGTRNTKGKD